MGSLIQLAISTRTAENEYKVYSASQDAEKTIGTAEIDVQNMLNETKANIENALRGENNALLAARAALGNFQKSAKNEAILKSAGSKFNAMGTNMARISDQSRGASLERRIQAAEQQGAMTAAFAASGTGGASQRMLKTTLATAMARRETRIAGQEKQRSYDMLAQQAGIMPGAVAQLDQGQVFAAVDHTVSTANKIITPMWRADYKPTREQYVLSSVGGQMGAVAGSYWGKAQQGNSNGGSSGRGSDDGISNYSSSWGNGDSSGYDYYYDSSDYDSGNDYGFGSSGTGFGDD